VIYRPGAKLWQLEPGFRAVVSFEEQAEIIEAEAVILATGAQERPAPFPGWTLPGVLTVGAAQILLKSAGQIPAEPVWIAGSGPLPLLYAVQLIRAGGRLAGFLDTTPVGQWRSALRYFPGALRASSDLLKGLEWSAAVKKGCGLFVKGVTEIEAIGKERVEGVRYRTHKGSMAEIETNLLLVHEGVVPHIHAALSVDCAVAWSSAQDCFVPVVDEWGESSQSNLYIAGDGAGIAGAKAAVLRGELAGLRVAAKRGGLNEDDAHFVGRRARRKLARELAIRPFLDAMFKPRREIFAPADRTIVCRCEEITAGDVRQLANVGRPGPSQMKTATRAGMGPCQGRQCGYTITRLLADCQHREPADVGFFHIRPPLKPVTVGELASLAQPATP
jgi:NADPH-dependent 2,4-dienoyl-CoA reductase/sulfur reductase-like enzyme